MHPKIIFESLFYLYANITWYESEDSVVQRYDIGLAIKRIPVQILAAAKKYVFQFFFVTFMTNFTTKHGKFCHVKFQNNIKFCYVNVFYIVKFIIFVTKFDISWQILWQYMLIKILLCLATKFVFCITRSIFVMQKTKFVAKHDKFFLVCIL